MFSMSRLNTRLFIGRDHKIVRPQRKSFPYPLVEVQDPAGFLLKLRITGKDPAPVLPRLDGILSKPSPDCGTAHLSHDASLNSCSCNFAGAPSRQGNAAFGGQLTRQSLYLNDDVRGENRTAVLVWIDPPALSAVHRKTVSSTYSQSAVAGPASALSHHFSYPEQPSGSPWPGSPYNKVTYISGQFFQARRAQQRTAQWGTDFSLASNPPRWSIYAKDNKCRRKYHHNTSSYL